MGIPLNTLEFYDMSGGMNDRDSDTALNETEWSFLRNIEFNKDGGVSTRSGGIRLNLEPTAGGTQYFLDHYYALDDGSSDRLVVNGGDLQRLNSGNFVPIAAGFSPRYWGAAQLSNRVVLGNGIDGNKKWDGTNLYDLSIVNPVDNGPALASVAVAGGTLPLGNYTYTYTYRNAVTLDESNPVRASASIIAVTTTAASAGVNNSITLSGFIASTDPQVNQIVIYRSVVNTTSPLFEVAIKANTVAAFTDTGLLDGTHELEEDNDVAPTSGIFASFLGRIYLLVNDELHFSKPFQPGSFPAINFFRVGRDGQDGTCLLSIGNQSLLVGKTRSVWILPGDPLFGSVPQVFNTLHGILNNRSASVFEDSVLFMDQSIRPYAMNPTDLSNSDRRVNYLGRRLGKTFDSIDTGGKDNVKVESVTVKDRKQWMAAIPLNSSIADSICVLDMTVSPMEGAREPGSWTVWTGLYSATLKVWPDSSGIPQLFRGDYRSHMWQQFITEGDGAELNGTVTSATISTLTDTTVVSLSGTATSGGASTLTDTSLSMTVNEFAGNQIYIQSGTGAGQFLDIVSNTSDTFTVISPWGVVPDATSVYQIGGFLVNGLKGVQVLLPSGTGIGQHRFITSNTADTIVIDPVWDVTPDITTTYSIGGIDMQAFTNWKALGSHEIVKRLWFLWFNFSQVGTYDTIVKLEFDFDNTLNNAATLNLQSIPNTLWNFFLWGEGIWGGLSSIQQKLQYDKYFHHIRIGFLNAFAGQPMFLNGLGLTAQGKGLFYK